VIDTDEVLALLDEIEPYPESWPQGEQGAALAAYLRVSRVRAAIAATHGMTQLQLMRAERPRSN